MRSRTLLIVEGGKTEPAILGNETHGLLSLIGADYEIVPFSNSIYELYEAYVAGEYDDIVSFLRTQKGLKLDPSILSKNAFSAVYLIFDFDPHHQKYSDDTIKELLRIFDNETELGKLYVNYPMVEAYYHLHSLPDPDFLTRTVSLNGLTGQAYKKLVNMTTCLKKNRITREDLCHIIMHNYKKARKMTNSQDALIDYHAILDTQLDIKARYNEIYVLSTFPFITLDYNFDDTMAIIAGLLPT